MRSYQVGIAALFVGLVIWIAQLYPYHQIFKIGHGEATDKALNNAHSKDANLSVAPATALADADLRTDGHVDPSPRGRVGGSDQEAADVSAGVPMPAEEWYPKTAESPENIFNAFGTLGRLAPIVSFARTLKQHREVKVLVVHGKSSEARCAANSLCWASYLAGWLRTAFHATVVVHSMVLEHVPSPSLAPHLLSGQPPELILWDLSTSDINPVAFDHLLRVLEPKPAMVLVHVWRPQCRTFSTSFQTALEVFGEFYGIPSVSLRDVAFEDPRMLGPNRTLTPAGHQRLASLLVTLLHSVNHLLQSPDPLPPLHSPLTPSSTLRVFPREVRALVDPKHRKYDVATVRPDSSLPWAPPPLLAPFLQKGLPGSIAHLGDPVRVKALLLHALTGRELKVAVLGGSITTGHKKKCLTSREDVNRTYSQRLEAWLTRHFPRASVHNIALPATGIDFFASCGLCVPADANLLVLEYGVNGGLQESMEVVVRRFLEASTSASPRAALMVSLFAPPFNDTWSFHFGLTKESVADRRWQCLRTEEFVRQHAALPPTGAVARPNYPCADEFNKELNLSQATAVERSMLLNIKEGRARRGKGRSAAPAAATPRVYSKRTFNFALWQPVAAFYAVPHLSALPWFHNSSRLAEIREGTDWFHLNDHGHQLITDLITGFLEVVRALPSGPALMARPLPRFLLHSFPEQVAVLPEALLYLDGKDLQPVSNRGWTYEWPGWQAHNIGDQITFAVAGNSTLQVVFMKSRMSVGDCECKLLKTRVAKVIKGYQKDHSTFETVTVAPSTVRRTAANHLQCQLRTIPKNKGKYPFHFLIKGVFYK